MSLNDNDKIKISKKVFDSMERSIESMENSIAEHDELIAENELLKDIVEVAAKLIEFRVPLYSQSPYREERNDIKKYNELLDALDAKSEDRDNNVCCPFCKEIGFDLIGLKDHLFNDCDKFKSAEVLPPSPF